MPTKLSSRQQSSRKLLKKGGGTIKDKVTNICIQKSIDNVKAAGFNLYDIIVLTLDDLELNGNNLDNVIEIKALLEKLKNQKPECTKVDFGSNIFEDITIIVEEFNKNNSHFQTSKFHRTEHEESSGKCPWSPNTLFGRYNLSGFEEDGRTFITVDPTIIQIMIFDTISFVPSATDDIVYSLKLIIADRGKLTLRYTTNLFPIVSDKLSKIQEFNSLDGFNNFDLSLYYDASREQINTANKQKYINSLMKFLDIYFKFYQFYKKCYKIDGNNKIIDYQLKYISILGKARFGDPDIKYKTAMLSDHVMSNLIFTSPTYAFMSGGYKGFKDDKFGITRSGYEIAKKYNRPILTIMCKEGLHDAHEYSDATLIYGEHWGEDTIGLSQLTDGAIIIAPFGGWTYVECLALLANQKIVGIYNDFYNILNYEKLLSDDELEPRVKDGFRQKSIKLFCDDELRKIGKSVNQLKDHEVNSFYETISETNVTVAFNTFLEEERKKNIDKFYNKNFFKFAPLEQKSIIDYYINYYLILMRIHLQTDKIFIKNKVPDETNEHFKCLKYGIRILKYLKSYFDIVKDKFKKFQNIYDELEKTFKKNLYNIEIKKTSIEHMQKNEISTEENAANDRANLQRLDNEIQILKDRFRVTCLTEYKKNDPFDEFFYKLIESFNLIKIEIDTYVNENLDEININYKELFQGSSKDKTYQDKIPTKCNGIWIKPLFDLIEKCIISEESGVSGGKYGKKGGNCDTTYKTTSKVDDLNKINIDYILLTSHPIFTDLNNNIIFVFSDPMYLNLFLNENLNSSKYQKNLQEKIKNLLTYRNKIEKEIGSTRDLLNYDYLANQDTVELDRSLDGTYDPLSRKIINNHLLREKYSFFMGNTICNEYNFAIEPPSLKRT